MRSNLHEDCIKKWPDQCSIVAAHPPGFSIPLRQSSTRPQDYKTRRRAFGRCPRRETTAGTLVRTTCCVLCVCCCLYVYCCLLFLVDVALLLMSLLVQTACARDRRRLRTHLCALARFFRCFPRSRVRRKARVNVSVGDDNNLFVSIITKTGLRSRILEGLRRNDVYIDPDSGQSVNFEE